MGLSEYLRVIWRRKWRVFAVAVILAGIVYANSQSQPKRYRAETLLQVTPARSGASASTAYLARTWASLAETRPVIARAVRTGRVPLSGSAAADRVHARGVTNAGFVSVFAEGTGPTAAERLAQAVAESLVATITAEHTAARDARIAPAVKEQSELDRQLATNPAADSATRQALVARYQELARALTAARLEPLDRLEIVAPARAGSDPVAPTPARDAILMFLAGLVAFSLVAVAVEGLSDRFSTERPGDEATRITGLPILAEIPRTAGAEVVEAFRTLRTSLMFMTTSERLRTLAIVSVDPGTGKTFVSLNLAREAAGLEVPVVLIDGDLRRPVIHDRLGIPRSPGLTEALISPARDELPGHLVEGWLRVLPSGAPVADPAGLFGGRNFREALDAMTWAELVVVDTPAGGLFADALAIASQCDATIIVIDTQTSRRRSVRRLVEALRHVAAQPIGIVLNRTESMGRSSYYEPARGRRTRNKPASQSATTRATSESLPRRP
jgi:capsular exopolysaccharide synthesis family protein